MEIWAELTKGKVEDHTKLVRDGNETSWRFEESFLDPEHVVSVCTEETDASGQPFTVLTVPQLLAMFDNAKEFRRRDPADFLLYNGKLKMKPF